MAWDDILDQSQPVNMLRSAVASDRVAHAYLFHGPDGVGKRAVAIELACTLQCGRAGDTACQHCNACTKVRKLRHPDVHVLLPQPTDATPEEILERLSALAENPYANIDFNRRTGAQEKPASNKQAFYPISRIREDLHHILSFHPIEGRYRFIVMTQADAMREPAANAFLKLLEEPGANTVLVLTTSRADLLLPTILSRCQHVRFAPLSESTLAHALQHRVGLKTHTAQLYARMASGSYSVALGLARSEALLDERRTALEFLRRAYKRHPDEQLPLIEELVQGGKDHVKSVLDHMLVWIRDIALWRALEKDAQITNIDKKEVVAKFAVNVPAADLDGMARLIDEGRMFVSREINLRLLLITLIWALGRAMSSSSTDKLYVPLA